MKKEEMGLTQSLEKTERKRDDDQQLGQTQRGSGDPRGSGHDPTLGTRVVSHGQSRAAGPNFFCLFALPRQLVRLL